MALARERVARRTRLPERPALLEASRGPRFPTNPGGRQGSSKRARSDPPFHPGSSALRQPDREAIAPKAPKEESPALWLRI